MEKSTSAGGGGGGPQGLRQMNLAKSFRLALRSLLTTCSKEVPFKICSFFLRFITNGSCRPLLFALTLTFFPPQITCMENKEFSKAFPSFSTAEQERLHRLFIQVFLIFQL